MDEVTYETAMKWPKGRLREGIDNKRKQKASVIGPWII